MVIDDIDRRILRTVQLDGRITNQDLANRVGLSPSACHDRLRRLREGGIIGGFTALLDPAKLERALLVFVEVLLNRTTDDVFREFAESVKHTPEIMECYMVAGGFDYLLKTRMRDMSAYRIFLGETLSRLPYVRETRTYAVIEEVKNTTLLPV
jgi:Lrp/AsnC family leucine-responsive transcriptional regulator